MILWIPGHLLGVRKDITSKTTLPRDLGMVSFFIRIENSPELAFPLFFLTSHHWQALVNLGIWRKRRWAVNIFSFLYSSAAQRSRSQELLNARQWTDRRFYFYFSKVTGLFLHCQAFYRICSSLIKKLIQQEQRRTHLMNDSRKGCLSSV